jgi:hypothetical protein
MTRIAGLVAVGATLALAGTAPAATQVNTLIGTDGPGFTITMSKKTVPAGTYVITTRSGSALRRPRPDRAARTRADRSSSNALVSEITRTV